MKEKGKNHGAMKKVIIVGLILIFIAAIIIGIVWYRGVVDLVERDIIYDGIYINDIDVGGLTVEEAKNALKSSIVSDNKRKKIVMYYKDLNWVMSYEDWGFKADFKDIIERAYAVGKKGSLFDRYAIINSLVDENKKYNINCNYDCSKIDEILASIKNKFTRKPKDAIIQRTNGEFVITAEVIGQELNIEKSKAKIKSVLDSRKDGEIELVVDQFEPKVTKEFLSNVKDEIGSFYTGFIRDGKGRQTNLEIASRKLNNRLLMPNEVLSVNDSIGPVNAANGYKQAPIILNGKLVPGYGGGICQIASTLYNAVLNAELKVVERKNHSMPVAYVPMGRDATLAGSAIDFKFKNSMKYPVYVVSFIDKDKLYVKIYGKETRNKDRTIEFEKVITSVIQPPPSKVIYSNNLAKGKRVVKTSARKGYKVKLFKKIYSNKKLVDRQVANFSYYLPRAATVVVGTAVSEPAIATEDEPVISEEDKDNQHEEDEETSSNPDEVDSETNSDTPVTTEANVNIGDSVTNRTEDDSLEDEDKVEEKQDETEGQQFEPDDR